MCMELAAYQRALQGWMVNGGNNGAHKSNNTDLKARILKMIVKPWQVTMEDIIGMKTEIQFLEEVS